MGPYATSLLACFRDLCRSIFETGMPTASMDRLVSTDCFGHIDGNTDSVMEEAARVLKRGGLMVFTTLMQSSTADATALAKVCQTSRSCAHDTE